MGGSSEREVGHVSEAFAVLKQGGAVVARRAHNPKIAGSNPAPAITAIVTTCADRADVK